MMTISNRLSAQELATIRKVLVIQLGPFGDGLLTTAYFETLKRALPGIELHYLIKEPYHRSAWRHPFIDRLITIPAGKGLGYIGQRLRTIRDLRREHYDLVIDQQAKPSSEYITWLSGARYRLGYTSARFPGAYNLKTDRGPQRYTASRRFDILAPLGIAEGPYRLYFPIPDEDQAFIDQWLTERGLEAGAFVVISPGSRQSRKKWLTENYAALADMIRSATGMPVVLLWAPDEEPDVRRMQSLMRTEALLAPPTSLERGAALLKRCGLLLCNDSGLNHLAVTTQTRTLAFFGNTSPESWSPASAFPHHHHLFVPGDYRNDNSFGITPEAAFEKVQALLRDDRAGTLGQNSAPPGEFEPVPSTTGPEPT